MDLFLYVKMNSDQKRADEYTDEEKEKKRTQHEKRMPMYQEY